MDIMVISCIPLTTDLELLASKFHRPLYLFSWDAEDIIPVPVEIMFCLLSVSFFIIGVLLKDSDESLEFLIPHTCRVMMKHRGYPLDFHLEGSYLLAQTLPHLFFFIPPESVRLWD